MKFRGCGDIDYNGWIHFTGDNNSLSGSIDSWAYEDSGGPIKAGDGLKNDPPVAKDQTVTLRQDHPGHEIQLKGTDPQDDSLNFSILSQPLHGKVALTTAPAGFTYKPDRDYFGPDSFTFKASDGLADSNIAKVSIEVTADNTSVADAGPDQRVLPGDRVILMGDNSTGSHRGPLAFKWTQESGPPVKLTGASKANATFIAPQVDSNGQALVFNLKITDKAQRSRVDRCIVNVSSQNVPPQAYACGTKIVMAGELVTLDGKLSKDTRRDKLHYRWKQNGYPRVKLSNPYTATPTFIAPKTKNPLIFRLTAKDSGGLLSDDFVIVNVPDPPSMLPAISAGGDQKRRTGEKVTLDGSGSEGPIVSFRWSQISGPPVKLSNPKATKPTFIAPKVGSSGANLVFRLVVTDENGWEYQSRCTVRVKADD